MKPILFSTPMVQAILDGRKTMTRRVVKISDCSERHKEFTFASWKNKKQELYLDNEGVCCSLCGWGVNNNGNKPIKPKYQVGDVLWVRETWQNYCLGESNSGFIYKASPELYHWKKESVIWKPSIFMPKEACRIFLCVTNVRVERLQDISEDDAQKEGVEPLFDFTDVCPETGNPCSDFKTPFQDLWNSINGKGAWEANPFVFVYEFQRLEKPKEMK